MSNDYRNDLVKAVERSLTTVLDQDTLDTVSRKLICVLNDYEITKRCTDVVVYDDGNERLIKRYCACLLVDGKAKSTVYQYQRQLLRFADSDGSPVIERDVYAIRCYLAVLKERGIANSTLQNTRTYIHAFYQWLVDEEVIEKNPCSNIKPIKTPKELRQPFSPVELDLLKASCKRMKERAIIEVLLTSGIRVAELAEMNVDDIDMHTLTVHVKHGKGSKERLTYITDVAKMHLQMYLKSRKDNHVALFTNYRSDRIGTGGIRTILKDLEKRSGVVNVHPHRFRRTFATGMAAGGMAIQDIQRLMGHSSINTTMRYITLTNEHVKAAYEQHIA